MFESIQNFFKRVADTENTISFEDNDHRLAAAALLTHVMGVDGLIDKAEKAILTDMLKKQYDLKHEEVEELLREATAADNASVDFYSFTSVLKRNLDRDGIEKIVEMLWEVVLADGVVHELEDNVVWRVAELLGVETRSRVMLRQRVEERLAQND